MRGVVLARGTIVYTVAVRHAGGVSPAGAALFAAVRAGFATTPR